MLAAADDPRLASGVSRMTRHSEFAQPHPIALLERLLVVFRHRR
jgi:hypothetical protein